MAATAPLNAGLVDCPNCGLRDFLAADQPCPRCGHAPAAVSWAYDSD